MLFLARRAAGSGVVAASRGLLGFRSVSRRSLLSTLAILEQREGQLNHGSLSAITAAKKLGGSIHGFVAGSNIKGVADEAAKVEGVEKVIAVDNAAYDKVGHYCRISTNCKVPELTFPYLQGLPENFAPLLVENIKKGGYTHIIAGHTAFGKNLMPRVAAMLDSQQISDITSIEGENTFVRPIYAGNAIATVESSDEIKVITIRGTAFPAAEVASGSATVEDGVDPKSDSATEWVSEDLAKSDRPDLATAGRVVSGGRGLKSKEEFDKVMLPLADSLGAAVGASRAAVDSGYADNSLQVGQTGKVVAPQLYLAVGISGAIQHLAGMKDSKVIAAINKDADAPIFQIADVGLVGDLFDKVPELTEKIKQ
ncbi:electron transfer flavoprotein domain-containing protein [Colletotrichum paranaense]|uniref:Probable electron transfer flavoprotein subunit alpha n=1 Tax=Colletotrichum paranaense TaxID=1914294 RepID=A0ABQ9RXE4_9PEZI|nr:electron transfer flavoprotein domain-containing protein [Colletotrichum paranaense]KAK1516169.1 electron transfer flavoprotein domain-containing protein [Colletotrichum paranaense]